MHFLAALLATIAFLPIDDRPVTAQLPVMLGRIAGISVDAPPRALLGRFIEPGRPDALIAWLNQHAMRRRPADFVISSDMLAYGGLVASRIPGVTYADAASRLRELAHLRREYPHSQIDVFGTVMRLAPTGVPSGTAFFAPGTTSENLQAYANLHDPPLASEAVAAQTLREQIGTATLDAYLAARGRNLAADRLLLTMVANGAIDRLVLGQDDAGPVGLHVAEVRLLQSDVASLGLAERVSIEPGADELGMALVSRALARTAGWQPRIAVRYSTPEGAAFQDPIEFAPIANAIDALIRVSGGVRDDANPQIVLYVRVPNTTPPQDDLFEQTMRADIAAGRSAALADLSFLDSYDRQAAFAGRLLASGVAARLDAYSSWNTNANTVGTALAEAIAAGAGRRMHTYDALAHRTFTFVRFLDDYAFHDEVRPDINATLTAQGVADHTLLQPATARSTEARAKALLWSYAPQILNQLDPGYHIAAMTVTLPWDRTFEAQIEAAIAPDL